MPPGTPPVPLAAHLLLNNYIRLAHEYVERATPQVRGDAGSQPLLQQRAGAAGAHRPALEHDAWPSGKPRQITHSPTLPRFFRGKHKRFKRA